MTLHEAIAKLLSQERRSMTANEIADQLNKFKWYVKSDKSQIKPNQIIARADDHRELFQIDRSVSPLQVDLFGKQSKVAVANRISSKGKLTSQKNLNTQAPADLKTSFEPISNPETCILILGTMPGDKSIEMNEYYGQARNKFWKIISTITGNNMPFSYPNKKSLLLKNKIGVWDVAHKASREGSLDSDIRDEIPNDLDNFISKHTNLKVIGFNGTKAESLFNKYFKRQEGIKYVSLPSTSPTNTSIGFEGICNKWRLILK